MFFGDRMKNWRAKDLRDEVKKAVKEMKQDTMMNDIYNSLSKTVCILKRFYGICIYVLIVYPIRFYYFFDLK